MNPRKKTPTHVYLLGFSDGVVKVGASWNPGQRIATLESEGRKRCALLRHKWLIASETAQMTEGYMIRAGHFHFPRAWGNEYFYADWESFTDTILETLDRWGVAVGPIEAIHFTSPLPLYVSPEDRRLLAESAPNKRP